MLDATAGRDGKEDEEEVADIQADNGEDITDGCGYCSYKLLELLHEVRSRIFWQPTQIIVLPQHLHHSIEGCQTAHGWWMIIGPGGPRTVAAV